MWQSAERHFGDERAVREDGIGEVAVLGRIWCPLAYVVVRKKLDKSRFPVHGRPVLSIRVY